MDEIRHETVFDTDQQHLGMVYAKALLGATERAGNSTEVVEELESLVDDVLDKIPQLEALLGSPRVPCAQKEQMLDRALGDHARPQLLNFLKILVRRNRFECLRSIRLASRKQLNEIQGRIAVEVRSAEPLDSETVSLVTTRLRAALGREIDLKLRVLPRLVAGIVFRVGDTVYDGSLSNQLQRMRDEMIAGTNQKIRLELGRFAKTD